MALPSVFKLPQPFKDVLRSLGHEQGLYLFMVFRSVLSSHPTWMPSKLLFPSFNLALTSRPP